MRLHEEERGTAGQVARNVPAGEIVLPLVDKDFPRPYHPLLDFRMRRFYGHSPILSAMVLYGFKVWPPVWEYLDVQGGIPFADLPYSVGTLGVTAKLRSTCSSG